VALGATSALMLAGLAFAAASPASAAGVLVFGGSFSITAGTPFGFTVTAASAGDTINVTSSCPITAGTTTQTPSGDLATFSGLVIQVGTSCTLTANTSAGPDNPSTGSQVFTVTPAAASKLIFTTEPPAAATSGASFSAKVSIEDTYGNVETSLSDTLSVTSATAGCSVTGTDGNIAAAAGVTTFTSINIAVTSALSCVLTATDTTAGDTGLTAATSSAVAVATSTPSKLGFTIEPSATTAAGTVLTSFAVSVEESNGIPITTGVGSTDIVALTSSCTLTGTTSAAAVAGVATFNLVTIKTGATCTLVATDSTTALVATGTSTAIVVTAGAATQVAFTTAPPTAVATAGTVLTTFRVAVEDVNDNAVTLGIGNGDSIAITSPCTLGGTTTAVAVAGVATFSALSVGVTGVCVLTATDTTRTLAAATATSTVGTPQAALVLSTVKGTVGTALNLATTGGTGTGTLSYTVAAGSSAGCSVSGTSLHAARAGTCLVTATKAGSTTYIVVSSAATRVTFVLPFKATRVVGTVTVGRTSTVTIVGSGFSGRPRIICNVAGVTARVAGDSGRTLRVIVTVRAGVKTGVHTFTVILANGKRTSVKFSLR
jgi:hypothetical protein